MTYVNSTWNLIYSHWANWRQNPIMKNSKQWFVLGYNFAELCYNYVLASGLLQVILER